MSPLPLQLVHVDPTIAPANGDIPVYSSATSLYVPTPGVGSGNVTNTGTLTSGKLIQGNGGVDITVNATTATVTKLTSGTPSAATDGTDYVSPSTQRTIQVVNTETGAVATGTTTVPLDDTIPQNTEGDEYMTLAVTPTSATNKLKIDVVINLSPATASRFLIAALFQDSTANALAVSTTYADTGGNTATYEISFSHYMTAGTTSATTFKVRAGANSATTITFNGRSGGRLFGGVMASGITITEIKV